MEPVYIKNFTLPELEQWVESTGERGFRARQLFRHLYARNVSGWDECTDLGKPFRKLLEFGSRLHALEIEGREEAPDGTRKYLFRLDDGNFIESVLIPDPPRSTICISSQVGCAMGCGFCLTGQLGLKRNLSAAEIVDQVCQVQRDLGARTRITNIVFMGMGEPLANYGSVLRAIGIMTDPNGMAFSHRRVTVSTVGLPVELGRLGADSPVNLAISLHAPDNELRSRLMPINRRYPLEELIEACRRYPLAPRKRITFEYVLLDDVNDSPKHARSLVRLLDGVRAKINLIPFNPHPGSESATPSRERIEAFQEVLLKARFAAIVRQSRGSEIGAACGQLAARRGDHVNNADLKES